MANISKGHTYTNGDEVNATNLNALVDDATITNIVAADIATNAIETLKIKDSNVTAAKLATDSVETAKIKDGAVTSDKLASGAGSSITEEPTSDHTASGIRTTFTAASNVAFGDVCYIDSAGKAELIDADAIASMSAICMAIASISADASGNFLLLGIARDDTWAWTVGGLIYGTVTGTTGNTLSQTAPSATDDVVQIMGVATHADRMYFKPSLVQVELT